MKKSFKFILIALVGLSLASCDMFNKNTPSFKQSDLLGLWQRDNTQEFVRFTNEQSDEAGFLLGREWNEAEWSDEGTYEEFLIEQREKQGYPGNNWFKYKIADNNDLTEVILFDNKGAEFEKHYIITKLTDTDLNYYEKDQKNNKFEFSKVVETK